MRVVRLCIWLMFDILKVASSYPKPGEGTFDRDKRVGLKRIPSLVEAESRIHS